MQPSLHDPQFGILMTPPLLKLPDELLSTVIQNLTTRTDIFALVRTNHRLSEVAIDHLYSFNIEHEDGTALLQAVDHGCVETIRRCLSPDAKSPPRHAIAHALDTATKRNMKRFSNCC